METSIEKLDQNFRAMTLDNVPLLFREASEAPFGVSGFPWHADEQCYCRLPQAVLPRVNEVLRELAWRTTGGIVRFQTDSTAVGLQAVLRNDADLSHMPRSGSGGFDLYAEDAAGCVFKSNLRHLHGKTQVQGLFCRGLPREMRQWAICLPLYNGVASLAIGLDPECRVGPAAPLRIEKPILFYGSSITQGGCASRPGNTYPAIVTRRLNANLVNLGFSGNAKGEAILAETIASLRLSAFVYDYDHNAPTPEHLEATHEPFFRIVRRAQPQLPVVMISRPDFYGTASCRKRRDIIRATYDRAKADGDRNVYCIDGERLFGDSERDLCTVDGCHPNDIGFLRMADAITPTVRIALQSACAQR